MNVLSLSKKERLLSLSWFWQWSKYLGIWYQREKKIKKSFKLVSKFVIKLIIQVNDIALKENKWEETYINARSNVQTQEDAFETKLVM